MTRPITAEERQLLRSAGLLEIEDAFDASAKQARAQAGKLEMFVASVDERTGRKIFEFRGDKRVWMKEFQPKQTYALDRFVVPSEFHGGRTVDTSAPAIAETQPSKPSLLARLFGNGK